MNHRQLPAHEKGPLRFRRGLVVEAQRFSRRPSTHAGRPLRSGGTTIYLTVTASSCFTLQSGLVERNRTVVPGTTTRCSAVELRPTSLRLARVAGFEPATPSVTGWRSSQIELHPHFKMVGRDGVAPPEPPRTGDLQSPPLLLTE